MWTTITANAARPRTNSTFKDECEIFYGGRRILMDLSKISVIIADDDVFKGFDIRKALEFNGVRNIMTVRNQEKLWE